MGLAVSILGSAVAGELQQGAAGSKSARLKPLLSMMLHNAAGASDGRGVNWALSLMVGWVAPARGKAVRRVRPWPRPRILRARGADSRAFRIYFARPGSVISSTQGSGTARTSPLARSLRRQRGDQ